MKLSAVSAMLERIAESHDRDWTVGPDRVVVSTANGKRSQEIRFALQGDHVVLTSIVLGSAAVTRTPARWRALAVRAWERNAESNLVTFSFDRRNRLVARVRHLAAHLDPAELELYVCVLAAESDRFEYVLSGGDRF